MHPTPGCSTSTDPAGPGRPDDDIEPEDLPRRIRAAMATADKLGIPGFINPEGPSIADRRMAASAQFGPKGRPLGEAPRVYNLAPLGPRIAAGRGLPMIDSHASAADRRIDAVKRKLDALIKRLDSAPIFFDEAGEGAAGVPGRPSPRHLRSKSAWRTLPAERSISTSVFRLKRAGISSWTSVSAPLESSRRWRSSAPMLLNSTW